MAVVRSASYGFILIRPDGTRRMPISGFRTRAEAREEAEWYLTHEKGWVSARQYGTAADGTRRAEWIAGHNGGLGKGWAPVPWED